MKAYADAMITHGRDVYGDTHSPLFGEELDRRTMRMLEGESLRKAAEPQYPELNGGVFVRGIVCSEEAIFSIAKNPTKFFF
ncbi:MAG: hypothetical protein D3924_11910 [Candidatus Electrothrix sp. AR4]|nr:hypothetical protein [Candidatus Electrothrix sp. AR4]